MTETINERLQILINALGFKSLNQFDRALGVTRNTTSHYCNVEKPKKPGPDFLGKILITFPQVDGRWLLIGSGEMFTPDKLYKEYVENLEQKLLESEKKSRRYETMIDMAAQRNMPNFQPLSDVPPVTPIYPLFSRILLKKTA